MSGEQYTRIKEGFRLAFNGMKLNSVPDHLSPGKYAMALNVRALIGSSTQTRQGQTLRFSAGAGVITDIHTYVALGTDDKPRTLARDMADAIWLDTGVQVGSLATAAPAPLGASMLPFRPNQSPNPYLYVANGLDYQKFSAPNAANAVIQQKVGIMEPQVTPDAALFNESMVLCGSANPGWVAGGTAAVAVNGSRLTDIVGVVLPDPNPTVFLWSLQVSSGGGMGGGGSISYQRQMELTIGGEGFLCLDVFPALATPLTIAGIYYFAGATGRCIVVPVALGTGPGNDDSSTYTQNLLATLRRGALITIGAEVCIVWSITSGPDGSVAIETSTTAAHTTADQLTSLPTIQVSGGTPTAGQAISELDVSYGVAVGIGTQTAPLNVNPFTAAGVSFQPDDYLSFGLLVDNLANLNEVKILFDVGDGTFTKDFYYYTVRPSDIAAAVANTLTQLAAAQLVSQRATIDEETAAASGNTLTTASSAQLLPGSGVWSQIVVPISALTRVGSDETKSLQNVGHIQFLWNAGGNINVATGVTVLFGGSQPDVGDTGAPYLYRVRPRSSVTGALGNPSPATRYGVSPRRGVISLALPSAAYDPQIDTWDILRYGGSVPSWRFIGSVPSATASFLDNYDDAAALAGDALDFDNFEPWPSVDLPLNAVTLSVTGTTALVTISAPTNALRYLPGNLVKLGGQNVYTLRQRPVLVAGTTYRFEFVENAGVSGAGVASIYEPALARQLLPYMWGPDVNGTVFACGDPLRPGTLYYAKNFQPDSAPDTYNLEITPPMEPLMGGEVLDGLSFVASTERWWALYPQPQNPAQRYNVVQQPMTRGLAAPFGHCNDGTSIYFWAKDSIQSSTKGSLTDDDLYNLFPHEGVPGVAVTYNGTTVVPPDYSRAGTFRLEYANGYLYALYQDATGTYQVIVLDLKRMAWCADIYSPPVTAFFHPDQQAGTVLPTVAPARYDELLMASIPQEPTFPARVSAQTPLTNDLGGAIICVLATMEYDGGDVRAGEQWGDLYLDVTPVAVVSVVPTFLGAPAALGQTVGPSVARVQVPVSIGGGLLTNFLGVYLVWLDDYTKQAAATAVHVWQPSFIPKPETIADRITDWDDGGIEGAKWVQGFILRADTFNIAKGIAVRDADTLTLHPFTVSPITHNGESEIAYSFNTPFIAHMMRLEPTDQQPWRFWDVRWVCEPTPEQAENWQTQMSSFGGKGFMHLRQVSLAYAAAQPVTLAVTVYDGTAPAAVVLPATGGAVQKVVVPFTFNKFQLAALKASSTAPFQIYQDKTELLVGLWGRDDAYLSRPLVGSAGGDNAKV